MTSDVCRIEMRRHHILGFQSLFVFFADRRAALGFGEQGIQPFLAAEDGDEGAAVVPVHPAVQKRVGERRAHRHDVEYGVEETEVLHDQHVAVDVSGELEGVERQPAKRKHHDLK